MKKKIILISVFLSLILITATCFVVSAIASYRYDMENGVDILEGVGAAMLIVLGGVVVLYEVDLFYTVYYFLFKPKTVVKSILNILSNVSFLLVFFGGYVADFLYHYVSELFREDGIVIVSLFFIYVILRLICFMIWGFSATQED